MYTETYRGLQRNYTSVLTCIPIVYCEVYRDIQSPLYTYIVRYTETYRVLKETEVQCLCIVRYPETYRDLKDYSNTEVYTTPNTEVYSTPNTEVYLTYSI